MGNCRPAGGGRFGNFAAACVGPGTGRTLAIVPEKQLFSGKFDKNTKWREALVPFSSYAK
jgi:hypothetical protein